MRSFHEGPLVSPRLVERSIGNWEGYGLDYAPIEDAAKEKQDLHSPHSYSS